MEPVFRGVQPFQSHRPTKYVTSNLHNIREAFVTNCCEMPGKIIRNTSVSFDSQFFRLQEDSTRRISSGECAWVRCGEYRCLAFRDEENKWRGFYDNKELPEPVEILQML